MQKRRLITLTALTLALASTLSILAPASAVAPEIPAEQQHTTQTFTTADYTLPELPVEIIAVEVVPAEPEPEETPPAVIAEYTLEEFMFSGVINWGGYKYTYYSQQVLPGGGLDIPGRHVNEGGYIADSEGYIVIASDKPKGTIVDTPFGYQGKIYDRGVSGNHLDVYIR